jgi:hypothetical protein
MAVKKDQILKGIKGLHVLLSSVAAGLSATLIRDRLIPNQLDVIGTVGVLFIIVALLLTLVFWSKIHKVLAYVAVTTLVLLILLTFIQISYVVTVNLGKKDEQGKIPEYHLLIGYQLTKEGRKEREESLGPNQSEKYYIENGGYDLIPIWYGTSYTVMAIAYTLIYMLFAMSIVLTMGGLLRQGGEALITSLTSDRPTPANSAPSTPQPTTKDVKAGSPRE